MLNLFRVLWRQVEFPLNASNLRGLYGDLYPYRRVLIIALNVCCISCGAHPDNRDKFLGEPYLCRYESPELAAYPDPE